MARLKQTKEQKRDKYLQNTYSITLKEYEALLDVHGGTCWICHKLPKQGVNLAVDHCHVTAKTSKNVRWSVRGLLCWYCNKKVVGRRRRENAETLLRAYEYLMSNTAQTILEGVNVK